MNFSLDFAHAYSSLGISAQFRQQVEDFDVTELFSENFFSGQGEHHCFYIEKRGENTPWVAKLLAEYFSVEEMAIGYCGLKDRHAVTRQWFSVHLPGQMTVPMPQLGDSIRVLEASRHHKKLRRGEHAANRFRICLRELTADMDEHSLQQSVKKRIKEIVEKGVPNYFGEQRFGRQGNNLVEADRLLAQIRDRNDQGQSQQHHKRRKRGRNRSFSSRQGLYLSAARSWLFNRVLSERIKQGAWSQLSSTDTGPLWGRGRNPSEPDLAGLEQEILRAWSPWLEALEFSGLNQERRLLVMKPGAMSCQFFERNLVLAFELQSGQYATSLLRELLSLLHTQ